MGSARSSESPPSQADWWWIFDPRFSLRARAALMVGGSVALFVFLFSGVAGTLLDRALERQVGATFETLAFQASDKLDRVIHQRYHELQLAAALAPFHTADVRPAERRRLLEELQSTSRDFAWIGFADATGRVTSSTQGLFEETSVESRPWFRPARERSYVGGPNELPMLARELGNLEGDRSTRFLDLAIPVQGANGRFAGVLAAHLHWDWTREVQLSVVPDTARRERIGVTVYNATGDVLLDSGASGWSRPPDSPVMADPRRFRGSFLENSGGVTPYLTGFARSHGYRDYRGLGWLVTVRQPLDLVLAPARALQQSMARWGILFSVVLVLVTWLVAGRFVRRLRSVGSAAKRIREGDVLTVMPRPHGASEVAQMCGALGEMVDGFREKQEALIAENTRLEAQGREKESNRR